MSDEGMWYTKGVQEIGQEMGTSLTSGLTQDAAKKRLEQYGPNQLKERPRPGFLSRLWDQINNFLVLILIAAAIVSGLIGWNEFHHSGEMTEFIDAIAIMTIVVLNAILGLVQEGRAEQALAALKKMAAPNALVVRDS